MHKKLLKEIDKGLNAFKKYDKIGYMMFETELAHVYQRMLVRAIEHKLGRLHAKRYK